MFKCEFNNKQNSESTYSLRNPITIADSAYKICGLHLHLRTPLTFCGIHLVAEPKKSSYNHLLQNPRHNKCAKKFTLQVFFSRNQKKFCQWSPLTFWNKFKGLSMESRNIQTQICAPIHCLVMKVFDLICETYIGTKMNLSHIFLDLCFFHRN